MSTETRTLALIVTPKGEAIFHPSATTITLTDEAGGEYVTVGQCNDKGSSAIEIGPDEWPAIRDAIDRMIGECRGES